ncbi:hypothetical protein [Gottfriedia solisilvae]|nr:hypothetical protein [Gottfriedia solisilvae]
MNEKSGSKIFDIDESFECKESPNDDSSTCIKDDKSSYFSLIHFRIGNNVPCPLCEKWTNYSKYAKHAREKHEGKTTKEILDQKENLNIMYEMYQKEKQKE